MKNLIKCECVNNKCEIPIFTFLTLDKVPKSYRKNRISKKLEENKGKWTQLIAMSFIEGSSIAEKFIRDNILYTQKSSNAMHINAIRNKLLINFKEYKKDFTDFQKYQQTSLEELEKHIIWALSNKNSETKNKIIITDEKEKTALIKIRQNHGKWANDLKKKHKKCAVCPIDEKYLLIASHIKPWSHCESQKEKTDPNNGIVLCRLHDKMFEDGTISFKCNGFLDALNKIKKYSENYNFQNRNLTEIILPESYTDNIWKYIEYRAKISKTKQ